MTPSFETQVVRCFNEHYTKKHIAAMAYRQPMVRYQQQGFDVLSDSRYYEWYFAVECKSISAEEEQKLYFSRYFHHVKGVHQLEYENSIIERSGRIGFLAVELKRRRGVRRSAFLIPWRIVFRSFSCGEVGLDQEVITDCCELEYSKGGYHLDEEVLAAYLEQISSKTRITLKQKLIEPEKRSVK